MIWRKRIKGQKLHRQDCPRVDIDIHFPCSAATRQTAQVYRLGWAGLGWAGLGWRGLSGNIINLLTCPAP